MGRGAQLPEDRIWGGGREAELDGVMGSQEGEGQTDRDQGEADGEH